MTICIENLHDLPLSKQTENKLQKNTKTILPCLHNAQSFLVLSFFDESFSILLLNRAVSCIYKLRISDRKAVEAIM